jgi:hypothetical protein
MLLKCQPHDAPPPLDSYVVELEDRYVQGRDPCRLPADMIELEDERVAKAAIGALAFGEKTEHVAPCFSPLRTFTS